MKAETKIIIRRVVLVLLVLMLCLNIHILNTANIIGNQLAMPFNVGLATVQSNSMVPALNKGDLLLVKGEGEYEPGDIVVYQSQSKLVVHRIVSIESDTVTTKGDANNIEDVPFDSSQIKGKVIVNAPLLGYVIDFLKAPAGILLILVCVIVLIELSHCKLKKASHTKEEVQKKALRREIDQLKSGLDGDKH